VQSAYVAFLNEVTKWRHNFALRITRTGFALIQLLRWTKDALHLRVGIEERQKNCDALHDRCFDIRTQVLPMFPIPAVHGLVHLSPCSIHYPRLIHRGFKIGLLNQESFQFGGMPRAKSVELRVQLEAEFFEIDG